MKLRFTQLGVLFSLCVLLSGCFEKEEENPKSYVEYMGQSYTLRMGTYLSVDQQNGQYAHNISLMNLDTQSLNFDMNEEMASLIFTIVTETENLQDGTYSYQEEMMGNGVTLAGFNYGQTFTNPMGGRQLHLTSGTVEVKRNGEQFELKVALADEEGNPLKAFYTGSLMTNPNQ